MSHWSFDALNEFIALPLNSLLQLSMASVIPNTMEPEFPAEILMEVFEWAIADSINELLAVSSRLAAEAVPGEDLYRGPNKEPNPENSIELKKRLKVLRRFTTIRSIAQTNRQSRNFTWSLLSVVCPTGVIPIRGNYILPDEISLITIESLIALSDLSPVSWRKGGGMNQHLMDYMMSGYLSHPFVWASLLRTSLFVSTAFLTNIYDYAQPEELLFFLRKPPVSLWKLSPANFKLMELILVEACGAYLCLELGNKYNHFVCRVLNYSYHLQSKLATKSTVRFIISVKCSSVGICVM